MQMITEVGAEQNTMTIIMMPSEFVTMAGSIAKLASANAQSPAPPRAMQGRAKRGHDVRDVKHRPTCSCPPYASIRIGRPACAMCSFA